MYLLDDAYVYQNLICCLKFTCLVLTNYSSFTYYRCILITGAFHFPQMTVVCVIIIRNFPPIIVYTAFVSLHQRKKAEMSFLRVIGFLLVCVVLNHDADLPLYHYKMIFSLKINEKLPLEKCVCLWWKILTAWFPA